MNPMEWFPEYLPDSEAIDALHNVLTAQVSVVGRRYACIR